MTTEILGFGTFDSDYAVRAGSLDFVLNTTLRVGMTCTIGEDNLRL